MTPELPFRDEPNPVLSSELQQLERQLRSVRPVTVSLDAEAILAAARSEVPELETAQRTVSRESDRVRRWTALGASWAAGAIAGSLVTAIVFMGSAQSEVVSRPANPHGGSPATPLAPPRAANNNAPDEAPNKAAGSEFAPSGPAPSSPRDRLPGWSSLDALVSSRILGLARSSAGSPPLRAGSYVRLQSLESVWPPAGSTFERPGAVNDPSEQGPDRWSAPGPPADELDRETLLRELLGDAPASVSSL